MDTDVTTPNAELAYRVLDTALANRDHFNMGTWGWSEDGAPVSLDDLTGTDCGTNACLAGWTVAMAGFSVDSNAQVFDTNGVKLDRPADDLAAEMLGITWGEASHLFYAPGRLVESKVAEIFGPRPAATA